MIYTHVPNRGLLAVRSPSIASEGIGLVDGRERWRRTTA
jgi:hypothetical protein